MATAIQPAAACASKPRSQRTTAQTLVAWDAPDNGGNEITNHQVFRALAPNEAFTFVGNAGPKTSVVDPTASTSVPNDYYRVVAENAQGAAAQSNIIELPITVPVVVDTCTLPGDVIAPDAPGDGGTPDTDIAFLAVAEPRAFEGNFVITYKLADFSGNQPPPGSFYVVLFPSAGNLYISLDSTQRASKFTRGTYAAGVQDVLTFTEAGLLDSRSSFGADATIRMVAASRDTAGPAD